MDTRKHIGELPAFPVVVADEDGSMTGAQHLISGFTKREQMLVTFMAAIAGGNPQMHPKGVAQVANQMTDEALAAIERWQQ